VSLAYGAAGWTLGAVFRSAAGAIATVLLWAVILQPTPDSFAAQFHGILQAIYNLLPDASTTTVSNLLSAATSPLVPAPAASRSPRPQPCWSSLPTPPPSSPVPRC
jgi:hypothetical protein